ncbi:hypothetical protein Vadar_032361 [Vaccinium darrowii]|uniref:Uncharacterized protein n=1 Tax=Vaccinium darrowii TaxID=229202 RepID=A0ACB7X694_9ERIC|nr:hypothetical protein Vadar_032361 [Vaccinium darrowii]
MSARFLLEELPIRISRLAVELDSLPFGLSLQPAVLKVRDRYLDSFRDLRSFPAIKETIEEESFPAIKETTEEELEFAQMLGKIIIRHNNYVGAIDGTQIEAWVPRNRQVVSRRRKPTVTQNVMAICSFDVKFTYVYPGWEGSAHNGRVFSAAASNTANNFSYP